MHVIVHAGFPKTGSTSLQHFLAGRRDRLRERGIVYPDFDGHTNHWALTTAFHSNPENSHYHRARSRIRGEAPDARSAVADTKRKLADCLSAAGPEDVVILSNEGIGSLQPAKNLIDLRDFLLGFTSSIRLIAYGRNPLDMYPSYVQQRLRIVTNDIKPPSEWTTRQSSWANHVRSVFGNERCELLIHAPGLLADGDVVSDLSGFLHRSTGKDLSGLPPMPRRNTALSGPACAMLMALRQGAVKSADGKAYAQLAGLLGRFGEVRPAPKLTMPEAWRPVISARNRDAWNAFVGLTRYGEDRKAALMLPVLERPEASAPSLESWILSYADTRYNSDFALFCREKAGVKDGRSAGLAEELARMPPPRFQALAS